jgi:GAF domain-containing protein
MSSKRQTQGASLSRHLAHAAREMQEEAGAADTMNSIVRIGLDLVDGAEHTAISLVHRQRRIDTPAASGFVPRRADELQYEFDEGPCLDAIRVQEQVRSGDIAADSRWPGWGRRVADELGIRSMLCFRLFTNDETQGALNLYSSRFDGFTDQDAENGLGLAAHAAIAVTAALEIEQLQAGIDGRDVIGQAKGMLMERFGLDSGRAFAVLARVSQQSNLKLRDASAELVRTRHLPGTPIRD